MSTTSGQQVLLEGARKKVTRKTIVVVNSRDRQILSYPSTNRFRFIFRRPLKDILSIELVNGSIPGYIYTINTGWNMFSFLEGTTTYTITLTPGLYNSTQLAAELQTQLNGTGGANTYTASVSPTTQKLTVTRATGAATFSFLFYSGAHVDEFDLNQIELLTVRCPARFLGFSYNDYADAAGVVVSPVAMDAENFLNRIYLYINAESNKELHRMEVGSGLKDCFHIFFASPSNDYVFLNKETETPKYVSSPAPISRLSFLDISIRDEFYRLLDLNNRDVNLVFEITHLE